MCKISEMPLHWKTSSSTAAIEILITRTPLNQTSTTLVQRYMAAEIIFKPGQRCEDRPLAGSGRFPSSSSSGLEEGKMRPRSQTHHVTPCVGGQVSVAMKDTGSCSEWKGLPPRSPAKKTKHTHWNPKKNCQLPGLAIYVRRECGNQRSRVLSQGALVGGCFGGWRVLSVGKY